MFNQRKWRRAVERGTREFVTGAVETVGFGVGVVSGFAQWTSDAVRERRARKEEEAIEQLAREVRRDKFIEDALAEIVRRRDAKK